MDYIMKDIILQCACCHKEITDLSAAGRRANEGELEEVGPGYVKIVEVDEGKSVDVYLGGYVE